VSPTSSCCICCLFIFIVKLVKLVNLLFPLYSATVNVHSGEIKTFKMTETVFARQFQPNSACEWHPVGLISVIRGDLSAD